MTVTSEVWCLLADSCAELGPSICVTKYALRLCVLLPRAVAFRRQIHVLVRHDV